MPTTLGTIGRADGGEPSVFAATRNISWLDVYVDGRTRMTLDVEDGTTAFQLPPGAPVAHILELRGFDGGELVAATRVGL